jgi:hypothetical protein
MVMVVMVVGGEQRKEGEGGRVEQGRRVKE